MEFNIGDEIIIPKKFLPGNKKGTIIAIHKNNTGNTARILYDDDQILEISLIQLELHMRKDVNNYERQEVIRSIVYNKLSEICDRYSIESINELQYFIDWFTDRYFNE